MKRSRIVLVLLGLTLIIGMLILTRSTSLASPPIPIATPCPENTDRLGLSAYSPCLFPRFYAHDQETIAHSAAELLATSPDLNAGYIEQIPRYNYGTSKERHAPGDSMYFVAHIANRGGKPTGSFEQRWTIDGALVYEATEPSLAAGEVRELTLDWTWQAGDHTVSIELDPDNAIAEVSEQNNRVEDKTTALAVGFWVEQSVYDWFNKNQAGLGLGSVSWDDWAQRHLRNWNQMFESAIHPLTPQGVVERVRLDKVYIIPDGTWQDCANKPSTENRTVDLVWGFPSEIVGVDSGRECPIFDFYSKYPQFQIFEPPLLHEMSHARYLIDLYGLNVYVSAVRLSTAVNSSASTLRLERNVENDSNFPLPAYLSLDGELVVCQSKSGSTFTNCVRGAEGTAPRAHAARALVNLATVRLQDGRGNLIQGSPALPLMGFDDHLYYNRYPDDLMSGGLEYGQHSAYAWNRILGQRPVCGNYNAPCNIGEYVDDIPEANVLELRNLQGVPLPWAQVEVYQANPYPVWYGKYFDATPDIIKITDSMGRVNLGSFPFGDGDTIKHTWGISNALILLKITSGGESVYRFFEVTEANEAYWSGDVQTADYTITEDLPFSKPPTLNNHQYLPATFGNPTNPVATPTATTPSQTPTPINSPTPTQTPTPTATPRPVQAPEFDYPDDGQTLDFVGDYLFRVYQADGVSDYLWGFFQGGVLVWENMRDEGRSSGNEYGIRAGTEAHSRFAKGDVDVWVRALGDGEWSDAAVITIHLK